MAVDQSSRRCVDPPLFYNGLDDGLRRPAVHCRHYLWPPSPHSWLLHWWTARNIVQEDSARECGQQPFNKTAFSSTRKKARLETEPDLNIFKCNSAESARAGFQINCYGIFGDKTINYRTTFQVC